MLIVNNLPEDMVLLSILLIDTILLIAALFRELRRPASFALTVASILLILSTIIFLFYQEHTLDITEDLVGASEDIDTAS